MPRVSGLFITLSCSLLFILLFVFTLPLFAHDAHNAYEPEPASLDWQTGNLWNEDKAIRVRFRAEHFPPSSDLHSDREISEQIHVKGSPFQTFTVCARQIEAEGAEILGSYSQANTGENSTHWIRLEETEASLTLTGSHRCSASTVAGLDTQLRLQTHYQWQNALISSAPFLVQYSTKDKNTKVRKQRRKSASPLGPSIPLFPDNQPASYETGGSWDTDDHDPFTKRPPFFPMQPSGDFSITLLPILRLVSNWQQYLPGTQSLHWLLGEPDQSAGLTLQLRFDDQSPVVLYISQAEFGELSEHLLSTRQLLHWLAPKLNGRAIFVQQLLELSESMAETTVWPEETLQSIQQQLAIILEQPDTEFSLIFEYHDLTGRLSNSLPPGSTQLGNILPKVINPSTAGASASGQTSSGRTSTGRENNQQHKPNTLYPNLGNKDEETGADTRSTSPLHYTIKVHQTEYHLSKPQVLINLPDLVSRAGFLLNCQDCPRSGIALTDMLAHAEGHCLACDQCQGFVPGVGTLEARRRMLQSHTGSQCQNYQGEVLTPPLMDDGLTTLHFMFRFGTEETLLDLLQYFDLSITEADLQQRDRYGRTLLHDLAQYSPPPIIDAFIQRFKSIIKPEHLQIPDNHTWTPLHYLFQIQPEDVILTTVDNIGELITFQTLTLQNHRGETLLHILYHRDFRQAIHRLLSQHIGEGESPRIRHLLPLNDNSGVTLAHIVFDSGDDRFIYDFIDRESSLLTSAILAMPNRKGETPVHILFQKGSVDAVKRFIEAFSVHLTGDILGKQNETDGNTPLHTLFARADPILIETLMSECSTHLVEKLMTTKKRHGLSVVQAQTKTSPTPTEDIIKAFEQNTQTITTAMLAAPNNKGITPFQILIQREIKPRDLFTWLLRSMFNVAVNEFLDRIDRSRATWGELYRALNSLSAPAKADETVTQLLNLMRPLFSSAAQTCPICLEEMDSSVLMPCCKFVVHRQCIASWLKIAKNCPHCRKPADSRRLEVLPNIKIETLPSPVLPVPEPESPLLRAIKKGEITEIDRFINDVSDLLTEDTQGLPPLHYVMEHFSDDQLKAFWQQCSGWLKPKLLSTNTGAQGSPIDRLKLRQNLSERTVKSFLDRAKLQLPEDINEQDKIGETILHRVARKGDTTTVKDLIQWGAQVDKANNNGSPPLYTAAYKGHTDTVQTLIDQGANVNQVRTTDGSTALMVAAFKGHTATVQTLIDRGANVNQGMTDIGYAALMVAALKGHTDTVQTLIDRGANVNQEANNGWTALMAAAFKGYTATVQTLIDRGASVNQQINGVTPLMEAASTGHTDTVQALIDRGANVNQAANNGWTALVGAAFNGRTDTVQTLIDLGANVNQGTPLIKAAYTGRTNTVQTLIARGAKVNQGRTTDGYTALMAAAQNGHTATVQMLIDRGANVNQRRTTDVATALMFAAQNGHTDTAEKLIELGALEDKARQGFTHLELATILSIIAMSYLLYTFM